MEIKDYLPKVKENISLAEYTTLKIGGDARYFFVAKNKEDLIKAVKSAKELGLPLFILGGGSNILFSDDGFDGLIIKNEMSDYGIRESYSGEFTIYAESGADLSGLVSLAQEKGLSGIEWAVGVPGTIGGAIYGNAQAFYFKISDFVKEIEMLDMETLEIKELSNEECTFSPKNSIFKKNKKLIIVSVVLDLKKGDKEEISEKMKEFLSHRKKKHPLDFPSAGSVFINKEIKIEDPELLKKFPELEEINKSGMIPSGFLVDKCGLKGKKIGQAQISEKHANFIINLGGAKAEDVLALIKLMKEKVKETFGISLEEEIQIIV